MRILVVSQYFWPEQFKINDLCEALIERGHEVVVYTGLPNYPEGKFFQGYSLAGPYSEKYGKIKIIRAPLFPRGKNNSLLLVINYFSFCIFSTLLAPFLVKGKFDKIFIYQVSPIFAALPAVLLKYIKKAPIIIWVTDLWPESLEAVGVVKNKNILSWVGLFVKFIYRHSDKIYISSRGFASKIRAYDVNESKIKFWPQWAEGFFNKEVQTSNYSDDRIPSNGFVVTFAGNIGNAQDFETVVEAATVLKNNSDIHFVILGEGLMKNWAEKEVEARGLEKTFHFLGRKPIETMPYYFSKSDIMLVTLTDTELFSITIPSKVQSYLASGKPILAALNGEGAEVVTKWKAGLSCPASSPKELAETVKRFSELSKPELEEMGRNATACYLSEFEREKLVTILENDFKGLSK